MSAEDQGIVVENAERAPRRRLVVAQAQFEHGQVILGEGALCAAPGAGRLTGDRSRNPARVRLPTPGSPRSTSAPLKPTAALVSRRLSASRSADRPARTTSDPTGLAPEPCGVNTWRTLP